MKSTPLRTRPLVLKKQADSRWRPEIHTLPRPAAGNHVWGGSIGTVDRGLDRRGLGIWAEPNGQLGHVIVDVATVLLEYRLKASLIRTSLPSSIIKI